MMRRMKRRMRRRSEATAEGKAGRPFIERPITNNLPLLAAFAGVERSVLVVSWRG